MSDRPADPGSSADALGGPGGEAGSYTVLARKYRPEDFDGLIGQDALVRILTNAFARNRIPHAFILTGVRGVGKTTTARIIAKGLNCASFDGPTVKPCGRCEACLSIAASRHVDVLEMDAASRTGIDDIREIIESVRYRASQGRYKVYIIDEAHMLSKNAFNGLLKTLEEPPPHVKFILATTDIHKVPVTVLSRCMRFDLRRIEPEVMVAHLQRVCAAEGVSAEADALALVARASEGSVRDALSILDQAIAHAADAQLGGAGAGAVTAETVRAMLGLAERDRIFDLFEKILSGDPPGALSALHALYADSADPQAVLTELAEICHLITVVKVAPERAETPSLPPADRERALALSQKLPMRGLSRAWQMLLKALDEAARAPSAMAAAEMAVIRMCHVADLPSPEQLVKALREEGDGAIGAPAPGGPAGPAAGGRAEAAGRPSDDAAQVPGRPGGAGATMALESGGGAVETRRAMASGSGGRDPQMVGGPELRPTPERRGLPGTFAEVAALIRRKRDLKLLIELERYARPGPVQPGRIEMSVEPNAPTHLAGDLREKLSGWTGRPWVVVIADGYDAPTLMELRIAQEAGLRREAMAHPLVLAALEAFPGAELKAVRPIEAPETSDAILPQAPDDQDDEMLDYEESLEDAGSFDPQLGWEPDRGA